MKHTVDVEEAIRERIAELESHIVRASTPLPTTHDLRIARQTLVKVLEFINDPTSKSIDLT